MEEMIKQAKEYLERKKMSQSQFAAMVGVSEATISRWLKGDYPNMESIAAKVRTFLEKEEQREASAELGGIAFTMTNVSKKIWQVLEYSRLQRKLSIIYGDAGIGKTKTAREWMRGKNDVVMITATPAFGSQKPFLKLLARVLKTNRNGTVDDIYLDILDKLEGRDMTIIIDEAQHLTVKTLETIRSINDSTETAIVLIGNEVVYSKMMGKQQAEFAQLFSRIGMRSSLSVDMLTREDVEKIFGAPGEKENSYLEEICHSKFGLRGAVNVWVNAANNNNTTAAGLRAMAKQMGILV